MRGQAQPISRWRAVGCSVAVVFALLSTLIVIVGCVLIQFDDQYADSSVPERIVAGFFGGLLAAAIFAPATLVLSLLVGGAISFVVQPRSPSRPEL